MSSTLMSARMSRPVMHNYVQGDILVSVQDPTQCVHVYVDEVISEHSVRIRSVNVSGVVSNSSRVLQGKAILKYTRDPLLTRLFRESGKEALVANG